MRIFLSHSSRDKALVREIRSQLPRHINTWLDDDKLLIGGSLGPSIRQAIQEDADFVVIFLGREAVGSRWVQTEFQWALERERELRRVFILPILLDDIWSEIEPKEFQDRLYLKCFDQSATGVKAVADKLAEHVFAWLSANLDESKRKELEKKRDAEATGQALKAMVKMTKAFSTEVPESWSTELRELAIRLRDVDPEIQLSRLAKTIRRELAKWQEADRRTKEALEKPDKGNPIGMLGLSMTTIANGKMIEMLENCDDEIGMWEKYPDKTDAIKVLQKVHSILRVSA
jgi:hypothetical protein